MTRSSAEIGRPVRIVSLSFPQGTDPEVVYAAMLHSRMVRGWRGKRLAIFSIIGFCCVLFTYFGVNYLAGLHSYAKT